MAEKSEARYPLRVSYEHASEGTRQSASGSDLSLGGIFIETASALPVGALLSLEIESGTTKVSLDGRVLSRRADEADRPGGFAVRFLDLPNDAAASLHFIMSTRAPRKGTMLGLGEAEDDIPAYESSPRLPAASEPFAKDPAVPVVSPPSPVNASLASPPSPPMVHAPVPAPVPAPLAPVVAPLARAWPVVAAPAAVRKDRSTVMMIAVLLLLVLVAVASVVWGLRSVG